MNNFVTSLNNITDKDTPLVGGKASNLAKLLRADLPVPSGIVIQLDAFESNGMLKPPAIHAIHEFLRSSVSYAVRSSALSEDAADTSWAGQFDTFLNVQAKNVITNVEACHNSAKDHAKAYADKTNASYDFQVAVVVQEMIHPEYAGVLFTKDPITGIKQFITEYIEGLGEDLVSGKVDPKRVVLTENSGATVPFDLAQLGDLSHRVEELFKQPQDIEWAYANKKMWLVQSRPITGKQIVRKGYYLGEPEDLFYWGPIHAKTMYMSDCMTAYERFFINIAQEPTLPSPPKMIVLFEHGKNVWLINANKFSQFTEKMFSAYEKLHHLDEDIENWHAAIEKLHLLEGKERDDMLVNAWFYTQFAEFALYGAESNLIKRLSRFDALTRQKLWGTFTVSDKPTFMSRIDAELVECQDPAAMAEKYAWIRDGYDGIFPDALTYFEERLEIVWDVEHTNTDYQAARFDLIKRLELTDEEINALTLARKLAEFMDERKAWMMKTRHLISHSLGRITHGWYYHDGKASTINAADTHELWERYVNFKASSSAVRGTVASNGGKHFITGEVAIISSPTDAVKEGRIIVVPSTSPSYVPLMRKAKALITDHGGMMSHAAIVAREFNLPCIVGTRQATKVLKDGDKIVIDLVKGEVNR